MSAQSVLDDAEDLDHTLGIADQGDVVEERKDMLTRSQARVYLDERHMLAHGIQGRHQRVTLFTAFAWRMVCALPASPVHKYSEVPP